MARGAPARGACLPQARCQGCAFIEYAPLETAWVRFSEKAISISTASGYRARRADTAGAAACWRAASRTRRRQGRKRRLHAGRKEAEGVARRPELARKFGFETVDTAGKYELLALRLDDVPPPRFAPGAKVQTVERRGLTVFYGDQCPYIPQRVEEAARVLRRRSRRTFCMWRHWRRRRACRASITAGRFLGRPLCHREPDDPPRWKSSAAGKDSVPKRRDCLPIAALFHAAYKSRLPSGAGCGKLKIESLFV